MKVVIIGKANGWEKAPKLCTSLIITKRYECWGVNNICLRRPVDLVFNMHDLHKHKDHKLFNKTIEHVNKYALPMVTQLKYSHIPTCIPFPIDKFHFKYFANSIDYMVAYAIFKKIREIEMFGVAMMKDTEYDKQRPSLHFWLGVAMGQGIKVSINEPTGVLKEKRGLYGYEWDEEDTEWVKQRQENK